MVNLKVFSLACWYFTNVVSRVQGEHLLALEHDRGERGMEGRLNLRMNLSSIFADSFGSTG